MFRHPKYYKELRKRNRDLSELQQVKLERSVPQSDQAISYDDSTESQGVRPDPGLKQQATSGKLQAASHKRQASSSKLRQIQATSVKLQATSSLELETFPHKFVYKPSLKKFYGTRTKGLDQDKSVLRMLVMKGNLMWAEAYLVGFCCFQFQCEKGARIITDQQIRSTK